MLGFIILGLAFIGTIAWLWAGGIDYITRKHSKYKDENLGWDDNKVHTEGEI